MVVLGRVAFSYEQGDPVPFGSLESAVNSQTLAAPKKGGWFWCTKYRIVDHQWPEYSRWSEAGSTGTLQAPRQRAKRDHPSKFIDFFLEAKAKISP